jgi:hypothetical protein
MCRTVKTVYHQCGPERESRALIRDRVHMEWVECGRDQVDAEQVKGSLSSRRTSGTQWSLSLAHVELRLSLRTCHVFRHYRRRHCPGSYCPGGLNTLRGNLRGTVPHRGLRERDCTLGFALHDSCENERSENFTMRGRTTWDMRYDWSPDPHKEEGSPALKTV